MKLDVVAIIPGWRGDGFIHNWIDQLPNAYQLILYDLALEFELECVRNMLVVAPAAGHEMRAARLNALWR